jgi:hypothetical protein
MKRQWGLLMPPVSLRNYSQICQHLLLNDDLLNFPTGSFRQPSEIFAAAAAAAAVGAGGAAAGGAGQQAMCLPGPMTQLRKTQMAACTACCTTSAHKCTASQETAAAAAVVWEPVGSPA